jgi:hypothetical protein
MKIQWLPTWAIMSEGDVRPLGIFCIDSYSSLAFVTSMCCII